MLRRGPLTLRTFSGEVRVPERASRAAGCADPSERIQILEDAVGALALGPVADDVVYLCLVDELSPSLAAASARRLRRLLDKAGTCSLFVDAHDPNELGLPARNELVRCLFAHRHRFRLVVSLVRTPAVRAAAAYVSRLLGTSECVTDDHAEFDRMLIALAPDAHERIAPANWMRSAPSEPPRARVAQ